MNPQKKDATKPPSKNSTATAGASKGKVLVGVNEPHSNLPFSAWTAGTPASAAHAAQAMKTAAGTAGSNFLASQQAIDLPQGLKRGRLREAFPRFRGDSEPFRLYFMYNPTEIQQQYSFDTGATPAGFESEDDWSIPNMTQGASLGFALLFERIIDVWSGQPAVVEGRKGPGQVGTLWDIQALDRLLGVYHDANTGRPTGPTVGYPIVASFGAEGGKSLEFEGFINSATITHLMFDANMTPTRTRVDLSITQSYLPKSASAFSAPALSTATDGGNTGSAPQGPVQTLPSQSIYSRT
jgi:hypothetical protein